MVPTVWYFGMVPTVWYFGMVPTVWYFLFFILFFPIQISDRNRVAHPLDV
jgi:hypothetical protein